MRSRKAANEHVAEVARRRLELLSAELAGISRDLPVPDQPADQPAGQPEDVSVPDQSAECPPDPTEVGPPRPGRHARRSLGPGRLVGGWLHDRLPPTLQGRVELTSSHLTVVALLVAAALAVTGWWVLRAKPNDATLVTAGAPQTAAGPSSPASPAALVTVPAPGVSPAAQGQPSPQGSASAPAVVVVDVAGKVRRPGIASLPLGSRVVDAVKAAGGARKGVDLVGLNLARLLVDGEQILVGVPAAGGVAAPAASDPRAADASGAPGQLVNLNTATQSQLEELPGVGPVTAESILAWRTEHGAFTAVDELLEVSGIGDATLAEIAPFVTL